MTHAEEEVVEAMKAMNEGDDGEEEEDANVIEIQDTTEDKWKKPTKLLAEKISLIAADESVDIEGGVEDRAIATTIDGATEETSTGKRIVEKEISEVMKECAIVIEGVEMGHVANPNTSSSVEASSSKWKRPKKIVAEDVFGDAAAETTPTTNSNRIASCLSGTSIASSTGFCGREKEDAESQFADLLRQHPFKLQARRTKFTMTAAATKGGVVIFKEMADGMRYLYNW